MIPVDQTNFTEDMGDCLGACIASILGMSLEDLPNFFEDPETHYTYKVLEWSKSIGYSIIEVMFAEYDPKVLEDVWVIAIGPSPRSKDDTVYHSVVYYNDKMVHDPHPARIGLKRVDRYVLFVDMNPRPKYV